MKTARALLLRARLRCVESLLLAFPTNHRAVQLHYSRNASEAAKPPKVCNIISRFAWAYGSGVYSCSTKVLS